jgi:pimeloyl-ACP methyl ester carboxylesterase
MTPVVFVHGFLGGSQQWNEQAHALSDFHVIALDLPGFGENAQMAPLNNIAHYAQWAIAELTDRGVDRFHLIGHSMGGMIAQEIALRAPDRVDRLVLYGTGPTGVLPGRFETISTSKRRAIEDGPRVTARRIAATWFLNQEDASPYEKCALIAEKCSLQTILAGLDAMQAWSAKNQLTKIRARTLVVWGDRDRTYPWDQTEALWHTIENAGLSVMADCAHSAHLEQPELFNMVLKTFLIKAP